MAAVVAAIRHQSFKRLRRLSSIRKKSSRTSEVAFSGVPRESTTPILRPINILLKQDLVRDVYDSKTVQIGIALVILLNFFISICHTQILPAEGTRLEEAFKLCELAFTCIFTFELCVNMYAHFFFKFWSDMWNLFDLVVVAVSLLSLALTNLPGISVLRLFRAFRVFRLFRRIKSLRRLIEGVLASMPGVCNAFLVLILLMGIWSIIGVEFFHEYEEQHFGNFLKAMFTMWQMLTMDSWASGVTRRLIFEHKLPLAAVFSISYIFLAGIVMANVVVAVLLDKFLNSVADDEEREREQQLLASSQEINENDFANTDNNNDSTHRKNNASETLVEMTQKRTDERERAKMLIQALCQREKLEQLERPALAAVAACLWKRVGPLTNSLN